MRHEPRLDMNEGTKLGMPGRALNGDFWVLPYSPFSTAPEYPIRGAQAQRHDRQRRVGGE